MSVSFPTDAALLYIGLIKIGIEALLSRVKLRHSFARAAKRAQIMTKRYFYDNQAAFAEPLQQARIIGSKL